MNNKPGKYLSGIVIISIVFLFQTSCTSESGFMDPTEATNEYLGGKKEGKWIEYFNEDWEWVGENNDTAYYRLIIYNEGRPAMGELVRDYYMSGQIQAESFLTETEPDVIFGDGLAKWYYENGKVSSEKNYKDGKLNGPLKDYFENGKLEFSCMYKNGVLEDTLRIYYDNGNLKTESLWSKGELIGESKFYAIEGELVKKIILLDDSKVKTETFTSGEKVEETIVANGELEKKKCFEGGVEIDCPQEFDLVVILGSFVIIQEQLNTLIGATENYESYWFTQQLEQVAQEYALLNIMLELINESNSPTISYLTQSAEYGALAISRLKDFLLYQRQNDLEDAMIAIELHGQFLANAIELAVEEGIEINDDYTEVLTQSPQESIYGYITGNNVYLRSQPQIDGNNILGQLQKGEMVRISDYYQDQNDNGEVKSVRNTFIYPKDGGNKIKLGPGKGMRIVSHYTEYDGYYEVEVDLDKRKKMTGFVKRSDLKSLYGDYWYKVESSKYTGWVHGDYVQSNS